MITDEGQGDEAVEFFCSERLETKVEDAVIGRHIP